MKGKHLWDAWCSQHGMHPFDCWDLHHPAVRDHGCRLAHACDVCHPVPPTLVSP